MKKDRIKKEKYETDDIKLVKKLIVILIIVVIVVTGFYFLTDRVVENKEKEKETVEINYDNATVGTILNRPYDEYMVLLYDSEKSEAAYYSTLLSKFTSTSDKKIYFVDLSLNSNSKYVKDESNKDFKNINDIAFAGPTLLKIKNGKVISFLENKNEIKEVLTIQD